jgi:hypothetical protein
MGDCPSAWCMGMSNTCFWAGTKCAEDYSLMLLLSCAIKMTKLLSFLLLLLGFVLANGFVSSSSSSSPSSASATTASSVQQHRRGSVASTTTDASSASAKSTCLDSSFVEEVSSSPLLNNHDIKDVVISRENWELLSKRAQLALVRLIQHDDTTSTTRSQAHVYANWPTVGNDDEGKIRLGEQVRRYF